MEPRVFHLLKEFLLWEKYQIENQKHEHPKVQQQVPLTNEDLGQEEAKEDTSDEQDDAEGPSSCSRRIAPAIPRASQPSHRLQVHRSSLWEAVQPCHRPRYQIQDPA